MDSSTRYILYIAGFIILTAGVLMAASLLGVPTMWLVVIGLCCLGIAVLTGATKTITSKNRAQ